MYPPRLPSSPLLQVTRFRSAIDTTSTCLSIPPARHNTPRSQPYSDSSFSQTEQQSVSTPHYSFHPQFYPVMSAQTVDTSDNYGGQNDTKAEESAKPRPGLRGPMFPLSYKDGFSQWVGLRLAYMFFSIPYFATLCRAYELTFWSRTVVQYTRCGGRAQGPIVYADITAPAYPYADRQRCCPR